MGIENKAREIVDDFCVILQEAAAVEKKSTAKKDLSTQEIRALDAVCREGCCIMSGISRAVCLSLSSVTALIDRLVEKNLVRRDRSNEDRRIVHVEPTPEGRELREDAMAGRVQFADGILKTLTAEEQEAFAALFRKIARRIEEQNKDL